MSQPRLKALLATLAATALVVSACGGGQAVQGATSSPAGPSKPAAASSSGGTVAVALPKPEQTSIRIGLSASTEPVQFAAELANELGYYKSLGFTNVQVTSFEGDGKVIQALEAGALDFGVVGVTSVINSVTTSAPLNLVAMNAQITTDDFLCTKNIKTAAQVKGQRVGISTFGSTAEGSALISLQALGLKQSDITFIQIGNESARIAAMKGGAIGCTVIDVSLQPQMLALGFNLLYSQTAHHVIWGRSGLAATESFIKQNPNTVLDTVAAGLRAQNYMWENSADASNRFAAFNQEPASKGSQVVKAFLTLYGQRNMGWSNAAFTVPEQTMAAVNPQQAHVDVNKAQNRTFLQQLWSDGYYKQIGDPQAPF